MEDLTCPSLLTAETSDYGSRDTSDNDGIVIDGFCTIFSHLGGKGEIKTWLNKHSLTEFSLVKRS